MHRIVPIMLIYDSFLLEMPERCMERVHGHWGHIETSQILLDVTKLCIVIE